MRKTGIFDIFRRKTRSIESEGKSADEWCLEGNTLASQSRYSEALECLKKSLQIDPKHALAWFNMGLTLMNLGRKDEAINAFETFIKYAPPEGAGIPYTNCQELHSNVKKGIGIIQKIQKVKMWGQALLGSSTNHQKGGCTNENQESVFIYRGNDSA